MIDLEADLDCDLLIVGSGAAGAAAAITAKQAGLDVLLIDRFGNGGATAVSGGVVYGGGGTRQQLAAGVADSADNMFRYLKQETGTAVKAETLQRFCDESVGLIAWLESLGVEFSADAEPPKTSYPPDDVFLYYSGNETVRPYCDMAEPAPRGHRTVDTGLSGKRLYAVLKAKLDELRVRQIKQTAATQLIMHNDKVIGATAKQLPLGSRAAKRHARIIARADRMHNFAPSNSDKLRQHAAKIENRHAKPLRIHASRGVLLTTGGFIFNRDMVDVHAPAYPTNMRIGTTGCDGSGIRLGQTVNAETNRLNKISAWRFINPPAPWPRGIVVNKDGQRFCNEASYGAKLGVQIWEQQNGEAWLILDKTLKQAAVRSCLRDPLWGFQRIPAIMLMLLAPRAITLDELANKLGINATQLTNTVERYNRAANGEIEDELGKAKTSLNALLKPPFLAINIGNGNPLFPCPTITLGGLKVNEESGAVLDTRGSEIAGLYAAGRAAVGIASNGYVSGLSLADCFWSGRRAANALAKKAI